MTETRIHLSQAMFEREEQPLVTDEPFSASTFRFSSGVCGVRLCSDVGEIVVLPFQGQQIWSAAFDAGQGRRELTMRSMFEEPRPTRDFLATFGGFLQHCGISGAGGPSPEDTHPLHGELPNAPFQKAYLTLGEDEQGPYMGIGGRYQHTVAFALNYAAMPLVKLHAGRTLANVSMTVRNLKQSPMDLMYLAHINFRPINGSRLHYSAPSTPEHVRVRTAIPAHIQPGPGYVEFIQQLKENPSLHEEISPDLAFDPEGVFFIDYQADGDGWAHSMQVLPDGTADYVRHRPSQLPKATRWISRTPDQDAIALAEVGTCEPEGYLAAKANGNLVALGPGETFACAFDVGALSAAEAAQIQRIIADTVA